MNTWFHQVARSLGKGCVGAFLLLTIVGCDETNPPPENPSPTTIAPTQSNPEKESPAIALEKDTTKPEPPAPMAMANEKPAPIDPTLAIAYVLENWEPLGVCLSEEDPWESEPARENIQAYSINDGEVLVEVTCDLFAYNGAYQYLVYGEENGNATVTTLALDTVDLTEDGTPQNPHQTTILYGFPLFDSQTRSLTMFNKFRGLGDCGSYSQYRYENQGLVLQEIRVKAACDGNYIEPEAYPLVFPAP